MEGDFQHSTSRKRWRVRRSFFLRGVLVVVVAGVVGMFVAPPPMGSSKKEPAGRLLGVEGCG